MVYTFLGRTKKNPHIYYMPYNDFLEFCLSVPFVTFYYFAVCNNMVVFLVNK